MKIGLGIKGKRYKRKGRNIVWLLLKYIDINIILLYIITNIILIIIDILCFIF